MDGDNPDENKRTLVGCMVAPNVMHYQYNASFMPKITCFIENLIEFIRTVINSIHSLQQELNLRHAFP